LGRGQRTGGRSGHQQHGLGGKHYRRTLQGKVAGGDILQGDKTVVAHQILYRDQPERRDGTDMDGTDHHTRPKGAQGRGQVPVAPLQPSGLHKTEHVRKDRPTVLARPSL